MFSRDVLRFYCGVVKDTNPFSSWREENKSGFMPRVSKDSLLNLYPAKNCGNFGCQPYRDGGTRAGNAVRFGLALFPGSAEGALMTIAQPTPTELRELFGLVEPRQIRNPYLPDPVLLTDPQVEKLLAEHLEKFLGKPLHTSLRQELAKEI